MAEETRDAEIAAAQGIWQSVVWSALIGWFVLLAITFAATDVEAVNDGGGSSSPSSPARWTEGWAETVILISTIGQFFCGMACVTSCSRTFFAFSRDRATPGWQSVGKRQPRGVPVAAVIGSCLGRLRSYAPRARRATRPACPCAFFAVVSSGSVGLYLAYVIPIYLRLAQGRQLQDRGLEPRQASTSG